MVDPALAAELDAAEFHARAAAASADLAAQAVVRARFIADQPPPEPEPDPDVWPADSTWDAKVAWIEARAGVKPATMRTVGEAGYVPAGCRWTGAQLYVDAATELGDLIVPGTIVPRGTGPVITLRNVQAVNATTWEPRRFGLIEDCTFTKGLWALAPGFVIRRTLVYGGTDGMQCEGGGAIEESVIRDLAITSTSHNDFIQNLGGPVTVDRCLMRQTNPSSDHLNGLFCDQSSTSPLPGTYDVADSAIIVTASAGTNAWAMHAGKVGHIAIRDSLVRGRTVGDIRIGPNVDISAGY